MSSDPSTKDLIKAARRRTPCAVSHLDELCANCLLHALADRLEEVQRALEETSIELGRLLQAVASEPSETFDRIMREAARRRPDSPELSDPDTDDVPTRAESVEEPEDDPWEEIEREADRWPVSQVSSEARLAPAVACALLDLRESVGTAGKILHRILDREWTILDGLDEHADRLTTLEQHADRGSEAERELRERSERQDADISHLRQRVERLEAARGRLVEIEEHEDLDIVLDTEGGPVL